MQEAYIISAARTPLDRLGGVLAEFAPVDLGAIAMQAALERSGVPKEALDLYILGNVLRAGHGQSLPRQAAFKAGIPATVNGYAVDMVCSSGMMSVINAATAIRSGEAELCWQVAWNQCPRRDFSCHTALVGDTKPYWEPPNLLPIF